MSGRPGRHGGSPCAGGTRPAGGRPAPRPAPARRVPRSCRGGPRGVPAARVGGGVRPAVRRGPAGPAGRPTPEQDAGRPTPDQEHGAADRDATAGGRARGAPPSARRPFRGSGAGRSHRVRPRPARGGRLPHRARGAGRRRLGAGAHVALCAEGATGPAVRCAFWLGLTLARYGHHERAGGWFGRAARLLEAAGGDPVERGYLLVPAGLQAMGAGDHTAPATGSPRPAAWPTGSATPTSSPSAASARARHSSAPGDRPRPRAA